MSWLKRKRPKTSGSKPKRASPKERQGEYRLPVKRGEQGAVLS